MSVTDKFKNEDPKEWNDEDLHEMLLELSREHIPNDMTRHRAIIQALTILNIQNKRHIDSIENRNFILTWIIVILTFINILLIILESFSW